MKPLLLAGALSLCSAYAAANPTPQLSLSLHLVGPSLQNANYVIDADACSYTSNVCNDTNRGTMHDHEARAFDDGWSGWLPNWQTLRNRYQLVSYHISVRRPNSGSDVVACGLNGTLPASLTQVSLYVFKQQGQLHCWLFR